jgi:hypothetical protein
MKKVLFLLVSFSTFCGFTFGQGHASIPYQAVARDASGNLIVSQNISLRFTLHDVTATGTILYQETQSATTNSLGLFTAQVGTGTANGAYGTFASIQWSSSNAKFVQVEMDPNGGTAYINMGTTQMMAVPYAFYADSAGNIPSGSISADNALNVNTGNNVELGGPLTRATTITQGTYSLTHNLTGTGDFNVQNNGTNSLYILGHHGAATDGNIGVGNSNPAAPLTVGTNSILTGSDFSTYTVSKELVTDSPAITTGNEAAAAFVTTPYVTANSSAVNYTIAADITTPVNAFNYTTLGAMVAQGTVNASGTTTNAYGINSTATNNGSGTVTNAYGVSGIVKEIAGAHIGTAYGVRGRTNTAGIVTSAYGLYGDVLNSGTLTTGYGLYTGPIAGTAHYSVYASDATSPSYFAGTVQVGSATANTYVGLTSPTTGVTSYTVTLPPVIGVAGSVLANTSTPGILAWTPVTSTAWGLTGNTISTTGNFFGTVAGSSNPDIIIKVAGAAAGLIDNGGYGNETFLGANAGAANINAATPGNNGNYNVGVGNNSMTANTTGAWNTAVGYNSMLAVTTSGYNTAIGMNALQGQTTGTGTAGYNAGYNTVVGVYAGAQTNADSNVAIGCYALYSANGTNIGGSNTAVGTAALLNNTTGWNTAVGVNALAADVTGMWNTAVGSNALTGTTAYGNTGLGYYAGKNNAGGYNNTAIGDSALLKNTNTSGNTAVGAQALSTVTTSFANTAVGSTAMYNTTGNYNVAVGDSALFGASGSSGASNTAIGHAALALNTGNNNTAVGYFALKGNTAGNNTAVGYTSLRYNTSGANNVALGYAALTTNITGSNNTAIGTSSLTLATGGNNSALGNSTLAATTTGASNTAVGNSSLAANTTASNNTAVGASSLAANKTGADNTALGTNALAAGTAANGNTAIGMNNLNNLTTGFWNTAVGDSALSLSTTGDSNSALGYQSGLYNTTGTGNVFVGFQAGAFSGNTNGIDNVYIGALAGNLTASPSLNNYVAIGYAAGSTAAASNSMDLGNAYVTEIRSAVNSITTYSDGRIKDNIKENVPGLEFIKKLRPVTYNLNTQREYALTHNGASDNSNWSGKHNIDNITQSGFIAQEVEKAAQDVGYDFNGLHKPNGPGDLYGLAYTDFVMPLVKGMQEQQTMIDNQKQVIDLLKGQMEELKNRIATLEKK